jgi:hypothetical protein
VLPSAAAASASVSPFGVVVAPMVAFAFTTKAYAGAHGRGRRILTSAGTAEQTRLAQLQRRVTAVLQHAAVGRVRAGRDDERPRQ